MNDEHYKSKIDEYHQLYKNYKPVICPVLNNEEIVFNRYGFNHLIRKGTKLRPQDEVMQRFKLLPLASKIISSEISSLEYREEKRNGEIIKYWGLILEIKKQKVKVVIRRINNGVKHFYSIMPKSN